MVVGQGLAGTALAWALLERGATIEIYDPGLASASSVAAGLVTPVTGRALRIEPGFAQDRAQAAAHYTNIERLVEARFWWPRPALRIAQDGKHSQRLVERLAAPGAGLTDTKEPPAESFRDVAACAAMPDAARLDVAAYVAASRQEFRHRGLFVDAALAPDDVSIDPDTGLIQSKGRPARHLIWCRGYQDADNPWLPEDALSPAKGEIIDLRIPNWDISCVTHCAGHWLLPPDSAGLCAFGATYDHDDISIMPTQAARQRLEFRARELLAVDFEVVGQRAGIRPVGAKRRPITGCHPVHRQIMMLNGLGSKGVLWAPREAARLADMIVGRAQLQSP